MKKLLVVLSLAMGLICFTAFNAAASPIPYGEISFNGILEADANNWSSATKFTFLSSPVSAVTGSYSTVPVFTGGGFAPFVFSPFPALGVTPLWTFILGATTYGLNAETMTFSQDATHINISGTGVANMTGSDPTFATWSINATQNFGKTGTFLANTTVPEPTSLLLLGLGLLGTGLASRKKASTTI